MNPAEHNHRWRLLDVFIESDSVTTAVVECVCDERRVATLGSLTVLPRNSLIKLEKDGSLTSRIYKLPADAIAGACPCACHASEEQLRCLPDVLCDEEECEFLYEDGLGGCMRCSVCGVYIGLRAIDDHLHDAVIAGFLQDLFDDSSELCERCGIAVYDTQPATERDDRLHDDPTPCRGRPPRPCTSRPVMDGEEH